MMYIRDIVSHCLHATIDTQICVNDNTDQEVYAGTILNMPACLFDEEVRYFFIKLFRDVDKDEYVIEITLENPMKYVLDNMFDWWNIRMTLTGPQREEFNKLYKCYRNINKEN